MDSLRLNDKFDSCELWRGDNDDVVLEDVVVIVDDVVVVELENIEDAPERLLKAICMRWSQNSKKQQTNASSLL